jgi:hypothetical protein
MKCFHLELVLSAGENVIMRHEMLSSGMKCYHLGRNVINWDEMLSSGANVIIWNKYYHLGRNVIIWQDEKRLRKVMMFFKTHWFWIVFYSAVCMFFSQGQTYV